jgi:hypothetical protein
MFFNKADMALNLGVLIAILLRFEPVSGTANADPEWQARTLVRKQEVGDGLSTRGACYPFLYAVTLLWSAS